MASCKESVGVKRPGLPGASSCFSHVVLTGLEWTEILSDVVEGRGWADTEKTFDRIPKRVAKLLPLVYGLGGSPTGEYFDFISDTTAVAVRTGLEFDMYGENNFNTTAFSGCDLYVFDENENRWRWAAAAQHGVPWNLNTEYGLVWNLPSGTRRFRMYMPLRNRLKHFQLGTDEGSVTKILPRRAVKNIVYYGTSIIHGAYSVRSGLCLTSRIGRALNRPVINLGFSGGARLEAEMANLMAELDPAVFVCDPYHNVDAVIVRERMERFFDILCEARPDTPVLLLGAPPVLNGWLYPDSAAVDVEKVKLFDEISQKISCRHCNFRYVPGHDFYGSDEVSLDGVHPNDEAFGNMAKILVPIIRAYL